MSIRLFYPNGQPVDNPLLIAFMRFKYLREQTYMLVKLGIKRLYIQVVQSKSLFLHPGKYQELEY
ncbi:hypothetical protein CKQ54_23645 [Rahnella variigena]|uniref:Uncharacterized protein n=1 Tax=Rahnella variigena TaxID=574964 RepID=A0ABX9PPC4_9GAMM|nr:hypothetical protein D6D38_20895 [Rahnella variigena]RKF66385.1 hypothetical protein CKQ54_23645 [Rahnella variigena]